MFLERLDKPVLNTTYYVPNNNVNDMPNCTKYCHDRSQEACENVNLELFKDRGTRGFPSAENWLEESALPTGDNLKLGSVACFSNEGGTMHVAFIERVNSNGTCLISDSRYDDDKSLRNERFFRTVDNVYLNVGSLPIGINGVGKLMGFQYLPINDIRVSRDETKVQLEITKHKVNCRNSFSINSSIINEGCYVPLGIYNVLETRENDGYTWCKLEEGHWVAYSPEWARLYKVDSEDTFTIALDKFCDAMKRDHEEKIAYEDAIKQIDEIIRRLP